MEPAAQLTPEQIEQIPAGREFDALIHRALYHKHTIEGEVYCTGDHHRSQDCEWIPLPHYSTDIAAAWQVLAAMQAHIFSKRQRFFRALDEQVTQREDYKIAWPNALSYLEPHHICRAALLTNFP